MSQFYVGSTAGSLPSSAVESLQVDKNDTDTLAINQPVPTNVTASSHIIIANGDNGIETAALPNVASNAFQIRFTRGTADTSDGAGQTQTALTFATVNNSTITFQVIVAGFSTDNLGCGGYTTATIKNVAGVASVVDEGDIIIQNDSGLDGVNFTVGVSGANVIIQVIGIAGKDIAWTVCTPGIVST